MPPSIEFDGGFDIDLDEATTFLVEQSIAIAERFAAFFEASVERVLEFPHSGSPGDRGTRSVRIGASPYSLVYVVNRDGSHVRFIALAHAAREPGYWRDRL